MRYIRKYEPYKDLHSGSDTHLGIGLEVMRENRRRSTRAGSISSRPGSRAGSIVDIDEPYRPSMDPVRAASRMDMSTGIMSVERGFDFATEDGGIAIQRIQTNLSSKHAARKPRFASLRKNVKKFSIKKPPPAT